MASQWPLLNLKQAWATQWYFSTMSPNFGSSDTSMHLMSFLVQVHWRHFDPKHLILAGQIPQESKNRDIGDFRQKSAEKSRRQRDFGDFRRKIAGGGGGNLSNLGGTVATKCILGNTSRKKTPFLCDLTYLISLKSLMGLFMKLLI